ncbi:hypothetical protein [Povalibacter sp.]|uniref:hypothetical protein n=1 Tax=Povalibacter sp. TaxID=1962978 RepID=UPI002F41DC5F
MNAKLISFAVLLPWLTGCNPALQWREPQPQPLTKFVCHVKGTAKDCVRLTDAQFGEIKRHLQPEV